MRGGEEDVRPGFRFGEEGDLYEIAEPIGSGAAARVYSCVRLQTGGTFAVKVISLQRLKLMGDFESQLVKLNREVDILRELRHPRIVNLITVHRTTHSCFLVMELVRGGELFHSIVQNKRFNETEARYIFRQLLEAVGYMHQKNVIHRDLKPENILVVDTKPVPEPLTGTLRDIKIADFGLSKVVQDGLSMARTFVGTPQYWAPEVLRVQGGGGAYDKAADFWSLGAVLFVMLSGRYPFDGKKMPLEAQIQTAAFNMNTSIWNQVSEDAKDIVRKLLQVDPKERLGIQGCSQHPWIIGSGSWIHSPVKGPTITEVSCNGNTPGAQKPVPIVTQPSNLSDVSAQSMSAETSGSSDPAGARNAGGGASPPVIQVGGAAESPTKGGMEQETIFCLNELLKLQVSIAGSLEMACLAFRHTDVGLSNAIRDTFRQARDISSHASNIVSKYAQVAQQVSQFVLPDLKLAVQEKEPSLAVSLLGMTKGWVQGMKADGENIQQMYHQLQDSVHKLIQRAQRTKMDADRRLAGAMQVAEVGTVPPMSPRTEQFLALELDSVDKHSTPLGSRRNSEDHGVGGARSSREPAHAMGTWTKQLFEQLSHQLGAGGNGAAQQMPMLPDADMAAKAEEDGEAWKRDVLDLLFMAPGISLSQLPKLEMGPPPVPPPRAESAGGDTSPRTPADETPNPFGAPRTHSVDSPMQDATEGSPQGARAGAPGDGQIVEYVPPQAAMTEAVTHSSASLLRALRELKRVDEILQGCSAFWANMDGTVEKLAQMKEHTECLVNFAASSKALRERFEQRLVEYSSFWASLEKLCRQYVTDHQATSKRIYEMIREMSDAADVLDTAQSARLGVMAGIRERERQRRRGSAVVVE